MTKKEELKSRLICEGIEIYYREKADSLRELSYSSDYTIGKRSFNRYEFNKWMDSAGLFSICRTLFKHVEEYPHYKSLYKENSSAYLSCDFESCNNDMDFVNKMYKFLIPLLAVELEKYITETDFLTKATWVEEFKKEFHSLIALFQNPIV